MYANRWRWRSRSSANDDQLFLSVPGFCEANAQITTHGGSEENIPAFAERSHVSRCQPRHILLSHTGALIGVATQQMSSIP